MTESIRVMGKRTLTIAVAAATILWTVGVSAFVAPLTADAANPGSLVKGTTLSALYYYGTDGSRYTFPNEKTFFTWYSDFSAVETISDSELAAIPLAGNVVYRPGSRFIKVQSDAKTYAVGPQGQLRWIESEAAANGLAGSTWNQFVDDVPDVFFQDYTVGASLTDATNGYSGLLFDDAGTTQLVWNGQCREVTDAGFSANRFQSRFVVDGPGVVCPGNGSSVSGVEGELSDPSQVGDVITGGLNVSLASDTPASATLPGDADSVAFTKVKLHAQSGTANVDSMTFKLGGVGAVANIDDAYLYHGSTRLTDGKNINSQSREVTFSALGISLGNGEMTYATVRADIAAAANGGDTANFGLVGPGSVSSTATVSGNFPVTGNTMTFSDTDAGTLEVTKRGTISDPTIGSKDATIAKFKVEAQTEDAHVTVITLNIDEASDHSNYMLYKNNELLAVGTVSGDLVTFVLTNPLAIEEGNSANLDVTADIGGESGDTIGVGIEEAADVMATGGDFGFNMNIEIDAGTPGVADDGGYDTTGSQCDANGDDCSFSTIQGGDLTFAFNGPTSDDIQVDGDEQVLLDFTVTAENFVELQDLAVILTCETGGDCDDGDSDAGGLVNLGATANFEDLKIVRSNGTTFMGPEDLEVDTDQDDTQTLAFDDTQTLQAGSSIDLMFVVDVDNNDAGTFVGNVFRATLDMSAVEAEDANGDALDPNSDIVPSSDLAGNLFTVTEASLDVEASTPPSSATYVKGAMNVDVAGFNFEAGDASDVTVTDITYSATGENDQGAGTVTDDDIDVGDHVNSCSLYDAESGAHIDGPEGLDVDDEILFEDFTWTIPAGETKKQKLRCNFANVPTEDDTDGGTAPDDDKYAFFLDAAANVEAQDEDGDDLTPTLGEDNDDGATTTITITETGSLALSLDGSSPKSDIILGNSTGVLMSVFKADATDEDFLIEQITLDNCVAAADADGDCADGGEVAGADDIAATVKLEYTNQSGTTETKTAFLSGGTLTRDSMEWFVPASDTKTLKVMIDTNEVSATAADSGDQMQLNLDAIAGEFEADGLGSGETLTEADIATNVIANDMTVRKTRPTFTLHAASPSGASVPGLNEVLRFNVSADSRGFVGLDEMLFKVVTSDSDGSGWNHCGSGAGAQHFAEPALFNFYDAADPSNELDDDGDWTFLLADGDDCADDTEDLAYALLDMEGSATTPAEEIGAGETKTYVLEVDSGVNASTAQASTDPSDSIRVSIPSQSTAAGLTSTARDAISWDDDVEADDIDGEFIKNLPLNGGTLVF